MKEFLKELIRPKPIKWKQTISLMVILGIYFLLGIFAGYYVVTDIFG